MSLDIQQCLKIKKMLDNESRLENIKELLSAMKDFDGLEALFRTCCPSYIN